MKFYSELTKKLYDTAAECDKAESAMKLAEEKKKADEARKVEARKVDAERVEVAQKAFMEARKKYEEALVSFCNKWGAYHRTVKSDEACESLKSLSELINCLF